MIRVFTVRMEVPDEATVEECAAYVYDAVSSMGGGLRPPGGYDDDDAGDPMFGHHKCEVEFKHEKQRVFIGDEL